MPLVHFLRMLQAHVMLHAPLVDTLQQELALVPLVLLDTPVSQVLTAVLHVLPVLIAH